MAKFLSQDRVGNNLDLKPPLPLDKFLTHVINCGDFTVYLKLNQKVTQTKYENVTIIPSKPQAVSICTIVEVQFVTSELITEKFGILYFDLSTNLTCVRLGTMQDILRK